MNNSLAHISSTAKLLLISTYSSAASSSSSAHLYGTNVRCALLCSIRLVSALCSPRFAFNLLFWSGGIFFSFALSRLPRTYFPPRSPGSGLRFLPRIWNFSINFPSNWHMMCVRWRFFFHSTFHCYFVMLAIRSPAQLCFWCFCRFARLLARAFAGRWNKRNRLKTILHFEFRNCDAPFLFGLSSLMYELTRSLTSVGRKILCVVRKIYFDFNWIIISCALCSLIIFTHLNAWKWCCLCVCWRCIVFGWRKWKKMELPLQPGAVEWNEFFD